MNMIRELTKDFKYIIHLEDDWLFIDNSYYIKPALDILETTQYNCIDTRANDIIKNKEICQVLFNKNYAETLDIVIYGGYLMETKTNTQTKFILHEHYPSNSNNILKNKTNCAYWPHYSFRPSIFKRKILDIIGPYDNQGFFERIYADKYYSNNYVSCFYDKITCLHIGKLTSDKDGINAYDLNSIDQNVNTKTNTKINKLDDSNFLFIPNLDSMGNDILLLNNKNLNEMMFMSMDISDCVCFNTYGYLKNKLETTLIPLQNKNYNPDGLYINIIRTHNELICLNLKRRIDRKDNMVKHFNTLNIKYKFFEAVDGNELEPTKELIQLFKNNDFGTRKGVVGCALSHIKIWKQLFEDKFKKYYIIVEDDCELHPKFNEYLSKVQEKINKLDNFDILFLGYSLYDDKKFNYNNVNFNDDININIINFDKSNYVGGFFGYIISKSGTSKILDYIKSNGIKHGIDYLIKISNVLNIYQLEKFIIKSDWVQTSNSNIDSDIQKNYEFIDIYSDENFQYIRGIDSGNDDITRYTNLSIDELKSKALEESNCVCFNTLGFMKSKLNELKKTPYFTNISDGIYIKKNQSINNPNNVNKYIRIKMICNWTDPKTLCDEWNWMSKGDYKWDDIQITWEDNDIDLYVIINKPKVGDFYIPEKTIIYQMEPQCESLNQSWGVKTWGEWANPDPNKFLMVRKSKKYLNNVLWQLSLTYNYFKNNLIIKDENNFQIISSICSSKYFDPGHIKRIDFLKYIENKNDPSIQLHIFNKDNLHNFKSYQGKLDPYIDKQNGLIPYKYYFMCENNSEHNFITEKLWEPIICETLVFYWGCPNITDYINPLAFVQLDMDNFEKSYQIIKEALENNLWEQRIKYIREEKQKILDYYNFFPTLERIIYDESSIEKILDNEKILFNKIIREQNLTNNIKNICFIHTSNIYENNNGIVKKLNYLLDYLIDNNCIDNLDYIIINNIGYELDVNKYLFNLYPIYIDKIKIINFSSNNELFEIPTIKLMWYFSNKYDNVNVLYLHTKGISYELGTNEYLKECINDWINFMLYHLVNKFNISSHFLDNYDSIGVNLSKYDANNNYKPHWSGNFWLSKSNYIKSLDINNLLNKYDAEWFILSNNRCKYFELANSGINHYEKTYFIAKDENTILKNKNYKYLLNYIKNEYKYSSAWLGHLEFSMWLVNLINPKIIVELGVDYAHSTFALASETNENCILYAIDSFEGDNHAGIRKTYNIVLDTYNYLLSKKLLLNDNVKFLIGYFDDINKNFNETIDILHIDGLHTYEAVKNDFYTWFPKTSDNAVVLFHDTISFPDDVGKFFNELKYYKTNILHSAGLGILSKNKNIIDEINNKWVKLINYDNYAINPNYFNIVSPV
jgi:GR25 family glycosyltransferase involved in LPS biosynthesis